MVPGVQIIELPAGGSVVDDFSAYLDVLFCWPRILCWTPGYMKTCLAFKFEPGRGRVNLRRLKITAGGNGVIFYS